MSKSSDFWTMEFFPNPMSKSRDRHTSNSIYFLMFFKILLIELLWLMILLIMISHSHNSNTTPISTPRSLGSFLSNTPQPPTQLCVSILPLCCPWIFTVSLIWHMRDNSVFILAFPSNWLYLALCPLVLYMLLQSWCFLY